MISLAVALTVGLNLSGAENWPAWRGPRGDGTSSETGIPVSWSTTQNIAWKTPLAIKGHSSPVVWGDRIYVTGCDEQTRERVVECFDLKSGKRTWRHVCLVADLEKKHPENSFASATPATDGERLFVSFMAFPQVHLFCFSNTGELLWRANPGPLLSKHGFCSSPMLFNDSVILNCDQDGDGYLVAYEKATGKERWRVARPNKTRSYCTPFFFEDPDRAGKTQMVLSGSKCVTGYDAATLRARYGRQLGLYREAVSVSAGTPPLRTPRFETARREAAPFELLLLAVTDHGDATLIRIPDEISAVTPAMLMDTARALHD